MAQVKKFNTGGSVQTLKYGSIIKNGTKYEMDEETMKRLEQHIAAADPDIQQSLANDWDLLMSGQDVNIDTHRNQRSTKPSDFSEGQIKRLGKDKPTESRWHGRFNTDIHKYNKATQYLGIFDPSKVEVKEEALKTKLGPGSSKFEYITNDDGTRSYKSLSNQEEIDLFDNIAAYLTGDEAHRVNYDVSGWADFNTLDRWYKGLNNPNFLGDLRVKILNGQEFTPDEIDYLDYIGLGSNVTSNTKVEEQKANAELKAIQDKAWADFNVGNLWSNDLKGNQFYYDSDNNIYKINSEFMPLDLPTETRGFYFNEDFAKNNPGYDWLLGKVYFNGKWYNESELSNPTSRLYAMLNSLKYYDKNKSGDQAGANSILTTYWGDLMIPSVSSETSYFGDFYQNPNYRYIPLNYNKRGATYKGYNIPENYSVVKRMDLTENNIDSIGRRKESYIMLDPHGNVINSIDGLGPIQDALNYEDFVGLNNAPTKIEHISKVSTDKNDKYFYNRYLEDKGLIKAYVDPSDKNTVHVSVDKSLGGDGENVFLNMPRNVYEAISDMNFLKNLESDPSLKNEFIKLVQGNFSSVPSVTGSTIRSNITSAELEKMGLKNARDVINWFVQYASNRQYTAKPSLKKGGILKGQDSLKLEPVYVIDKLKKLPKFDSTATVLRPTTIKTKTSEFRPIKSVQNDFFNKYGVNPYSEATLPEIIDVTEESILEEPLPSVNNDDITASNLYGQHPYEFNKSNIMPEAINQMFSLGRLGWDIGTNNKLYDIKAKGLIDSSNAKMASMPQEIYSRQTINAGNAERELGKRKLQTLPPVNSDYIKYAAMKRAADDAASIHFANATLADSQQHSENLAKQAEEQRMYANMRNQIEAHNRGIQAAKMAGLSELRAARTQANRQSFANYLLEKQTEFDQNRQLVEQLATSMSEYETQKKANDEFIKERNAYFKNTPIDMGNPAHVQFLNDLRSSKMHDIKMAGYETQTQNLPIFWKKRLGFKSGGKVRSTQDQIKINKHKEFDQNWSNSNKAVQKAIAKMNDRVHDIIMKILSDEI